MDEVVLRLVSNGEYLAFIETNLDVKLDEIRKRLKDESSDLLPGAFTFLFKNVTIANKQESRLSVRQCSERDNSRLKPVYDLFLRLEDIQGSSHAIIYKSRYSNTPASSEELKSPTDNVSETNGSADVNEPDRSCPRKNKIDLYSTDEIQAQKCWLEKERMTFWNTKSQALQFSEETLQFKKQELVGALETSWAFRKAELLDIRISQIKIRQERYMNVFHEKYQRSCQSKNGVNLLDPSPQVYKFQDEISKSLYFIRKEHKTVLDLQVARQGTELSREFLEVESRIHTHLHQLKRSSDSLYKSLSVLEKRLDNFEAEHIRTESFDVPGLNTSELDELVSDVLNAEEGVRQVGKHKS